MTQDIKVKDMKISGRAKNCLKSAGVKTVKDLLDVEAWELLRVPNLGRKSVEEIIEYLSELGYSLKGQDKFYKCKQKLPWVVKLIEEAVLAEREACANMCDIAANESEETISEFALHEIMEKSVACGAVHQAKKLSKAIRARGQIENPKA